MSEVEYDFLIVGHGLAGSVLSHMLMKQGSKMLVIDQFNAGSSSQVAAGLVNPITGRRVVKSWMADMLLPFAGDFYRNFEKENNVSFYHEMDVIEVVHSVKEANEWMSRTAAEEMRKYFINEAPEEIYKNKIGEFKKMIRISSSAWMDIPLFIDLCRKLLIETKSISEEVFDFSKLKIDADFVEYNHIKSKRIIFCEGHRTLQNSLWKWLPLVPAKGEILTIKCTELPEDFILISGMFLIPIGKNRFRAGATYEWNFPDEQPTENGKQKLLDLLNQFLKIPFEIIDHRAGIRPTVKDRRPIIGNHPDHKNVLIFNGMGTKGVQLVPFFADHFVKYLEGGLDLMDEINVDRFF